MSTTCSGTQEPGGLAVLPRRVMPVNVEPGTNRCAVIRQPSTLRNAWASPSVRTFTPALDMLYAVYPGGQVMPCFEPVLMIAQGLPWSIIAWVKLCTPLITPQRL